MKINELGHRTIAQASIVILVDCLRLCNEERLSRADYERRLAERFNERTGKNLTGGQLLDLVVSTNAALD